MGYNSEVLNRLEHWGCDVEGALGRLLGDEKLLLSFILRVAEDEAFEKLGQALADGNTDEAFGYAHNLKGITGNTGITPLYDLTQEMVEPLRNGMTEGVEKLYKDLMEANKKLKELIKV